MRHLLRQAANLGASLFALGALMLCAFSTEPEKEAQIDAVNISGMLTVTGPFTLHLEVKQIGEEEIQARLKQLPLYGANPIKTNSKQRVVQALRLTVKGRVISAPQSALRDLFDPGLVYTLHVTRNQDQTVIAWAGGSGERSYRCKFYATSERFVRRDIYQLDSQSREAVSTKSL